MGYITASTVIGIQRSEYVPSNTAERGNWFAKFGVPDKEYKYIKLEAPYEIWGRVPNIVMADGAICLEFAPALLGVLRAAACELIRSSPTVVTMDVTEVITQYADKLEVETTAKNAELARIREVIEAMDIDTIVSKDGGWCPHKTFPGITVQNVSDSAVASFIIKNIENDDEPVLDRFRTAVVTRRDAAREEHKQLCSKNKEALRCWVIDHPEQMPDNFVQAAKEHRELEAAIRGLIMDNIAEVIFSAVADVGIAAIDTTIVRNPNIASLWPGVPSPTAYELRAAFTACRDKLLKAAILPDVLLDTDTFVQVHIDGQHGHSVTVCALSVEVQHTWLPKHDVLLAVKHDVLLAVVVPGEEC